MKTKPIAEVILETHSILCADNFYYFCVKLSEAIEEGKNGEGVYTYKDGSQLTSLPGGIMRLNGILRKSDRFVLLSFDSFDDGSIHLTVKEPEVPAHTFTAKPALEGFEVFKFNRETGAMDKYFTLDIRGEAGVHQAMSKLFESCVYYLQGNHVEGFANIKVDVGDQVICDFCSCDFTFSNESGGFVYAGYATCPDCAPDKLKFAKEHDELHHITATCPEGLSFADWVRTVLR